MATVASHASSLPSVQTSANIYSFRPKLLKPEAESETRLLQTSVAKRLGLNAAIFLQQLHFRLRKPSHVVGGVAWYEASFATMQAVDFPFWCAKTIERTSLRLEKRGIITAKPMNRNKYDRTKWYTINEATLAAALGCTSEQSVPIDATPSPDGDQDTLSQSLEEEKREKKEPEVSSSGHREEEHSLPEDTPPVAAESNQGDGPELSDHRSEHKQHHIIQQNQAKEETPTMTQTIATSALTTRQQTCPHPSYEIAVLSGGIVLCNRCYALLNDGGTTARCGDTDVKTIEGGIQTVDPFAA